MKGTILDSIPWLKSHQPLLIYVYKLKFSEYRFNYIVYELGSPTSVSLLLAREQPWIFGRYEVQNPRYASPAYCIFSIVFCTVWIWVRIWFHCKFIIPFSWYILNTISNTKNIFLGITSERPDVHSLAILF